MKFELYSICFSDEVSQRESYSIDDFATFTSTGQMASLAFSALPTDTVKMYVSRYVDEVKKFDSDSDASRFDVCRIAKTVYQILNGTILIFSLSDGFFSVKERIPIVSGFVSGDDFDYISKLSSEFDSYVIEFSKKVSNTKLKKNEGVKK